MPIASKVPGSGFNALMASCALDDAVVDVEAGSGVVV